MKNQDIIEIPVIDIFAGPGGLGEGFSSIERPFKFDIRLSIEKDDIAHETLQLRSFVRAFGPNHLPKNYYEYVSQNLSKDDLFNSHPEQAEKARTEAWKAELGKIDTSLLHKRIEDALGKKKRHWILLGGPPCQAYSLVGRARITGLGFQNSELSDKKRERLRKEKREQFSKDERHTLYKEYLKIVAVHAPTVFVMENVKGILSSKDGENEEPIFQKILNDLRDPWDAISNDAELRKDKDLHNRAPVKKPRYRLFSFVKSIHPDESEKLKPKDFIIRAEAYGIPQRRHRVIVLGILDEYEIQPKTLKPSLSNCSVEHAIGNLPKLRSGLSKDIDSPENWAKSIRKAYRFDIMKGLDSKTRQKIKEAFSSLDEMKNRGGKYIKKKIAIRNSEFHTWVSDSNLNGVLQHETRGHMVSDLWRYIYVAAYAEANFHSPRVDEFPEWLIPDHQNIKNNKSSTVHFRDRFKVQMAGEPATTITSHISKDGHYYIHYDPCQCRSLTVREAARLQTFPDNYYFEGNRTQQYHQVGNAVPPFLAKKMAEVVSQIVKECLEKDKKSCSEKEKRKA